MEIELVEIRDFLASHPPFDHLPDEALDRLPRSLSVRYFRRGTPFPPGDADGPYLYLIRRGAVELRNVAGQLVSRLGEGDMCTTACQGDSLEAPFTGSTLEDTLVYLLGCAELGKIKAEHAEFREHFDQSVSERLRKALRQLKEPPGQASSLMAMDGRSCRRNTARRPGRRRAARHQHPGGGPHHERRAGLVHPDHGA